MVIYYRLANYLNQLAKWFCDRKPYTTERSPGYHENRLKKDNIIIDHAVTT